MISFLLSGVISLVVTPLVRRLAVKRDWVSPAATTGNTHPATLGGMAVLIAIFCTTILVGGTTSLVQLPYIWIAVALMFAMGMVDDFIVLSPRAKLVAQVAVIVLFLGSLARSGHHPVSLWTPLFFLWLLGVTNALNLLDNMDGLTPGVGAIIASGMALVYFGGDASTPGRMLLALSGALAGFLIFNFHPARIYLGDAGSHLVGFMLAAMPLYAFSTNPGTWWPAILTAPVFLLAPISDTTFVTLSRLHRRVPVSLGGKDHISHRLRQAGLCERTVALIFYVVALCSCLLAWWIRKMANTM
jgi:UDP-GlcNAc:undecaprenyl-phosphate GlcNAc-1-phosphate transferase